MLRGWRLNSTELVEVRSDAVGGAATKRFAVLSGSGNGRHVVVIEVCDATREQRGIVQNLFVFYRYDLMPFAGGIGGASLNRVGVIGEEGIGTHEESVADVDVWWGKSGVLLPMVIWVDGIPAGLAMAARGPHAHREVDYRMEDFFVANRWRRNGVGRAAVKQIFARYQGIWEMGWLPGNARAEKFWRSVMREAEEVVDWKVEQGPEQAALAGVRGKVG